MTYIHGAVSLNVLICFMFLSIITHTPFTVFTKLPISYFFSFRDIVISFRLFVFHCYIFFFQYHSNTQLLNLHCLAHSLPSSVIISSVSKHTNLMPEYVFLNTLYGQKYVETLIHAFFVHLCTQSQVYDEMEELNWPSQSPDFNHPSYTFMII